MRTNKRELDRNISIFGAFLVVSVCLGIIFYAFYRMGAVTFWSNEVVEETEEVSEPVVVRIPGWTDVVFAKIGMSMQYPPGMELRENEDESVSMVILGPSQSRGTEVYDGLILNISRREYSGDFSQFVNSEYDKSKKEDAISQVGPLSERMVAGLKGYEYFVEGLGKFTLIYLPVTENKYVLITYLLEDPKNQGFASTLENILKSIKFE